MLAGLQLILAAGSKAIFPAAIGGPMSEVLQVGAAIVQLLGRAVFG